MQWSMCMAFRMFDLNTEKGVVIGERSCTRIWSCFNVGFVEARPLTTSVNIVDSACDSTCAGDACNYFDSFTAADMQCHECDCFELHL